MIAIDVDGVLANFDTSFVRAANTVKPGCLPTNQLPEHWDWYEEQIGKELNDKVWDFILKSYNWWLTLDPYQRNIDALKKFTTAHPEQDIVFLTSRPNTCGYSASLQTEGWLRKQGIDSPFFAVYVVGKPSEKRAYLETNSVTHFIDDKYSTVEDTESVPGLKVFLHKRSWNKEGWKKAKCVVDSLGQFFQKVEADL